MSDWTKSDPVRYPFESMTKSNLVALAEYVEIEIDKHGPESKIIDALIDGGVTLPDEREWAEINEAAHIHISVKDGRVIKECKEEA